MSRLTALLFCFAVAVSTNSAPLWASDSAAATTGITSITASAVQQAVSHGDRRDADRKADLYRKPEAVLSFFQLKPGQLVLDVFAGGGYYTELLARTVGNTGHVDAFNNKPYLNWVGAELSARLDNNRLPNVSRLDAEVDELVLTAKHYDVIFASMAFHDAYYADPAEGWPAMDRAALYRKLFQALKPGGVLAVIDHSARAGRGSDDSKSLHRIEESLLRRELEQAGFRFDASSDVLRNPQDDRSVSSFEARIRFQTDRFVLRFKRPQ